MGARNAIDRYLVLRAGIVSHRPQSFRRAAGAVSRVFAWADASQPHPAGVVEHGLASVEFHVRLEPRVPTGRLADHQRIAWPKIGGYGACAIRASFALRFQSAQRNTPRNDPIDFRAVDILASPAR
jgi:hypothetical protein